MTSWTTAWCETTLIFSTTAHVSLRNPMNPGFVMSAAFDMPHLAVDDIAASPVSVASRLRLCSWLVRWSVSAILHCHTQALWTTSHGRRENAPYITHTLSLVCQWSCENLCVNFVDAAIWRFVAKWWVYLYKNDMSLPVLPNSFIPLHRTTVTGTNSIMVLRNWETFSMMITSPPRQIQLRGMVSCTR